MTRCSCCGAAQLDPATCVSCDAQMSSPPHVGLRWLTVIGDEHDCQPTFPALGLDHETAWRMNRADTPSSEGGDR